MENYGLTSNDLSYVQNKIDRQKKYLEETTFITGNGQIKSLLDVSHHANHSLRYYAQLVNKINTMTDFTKTLGLVPVFITSTLDGFYRDLLHENDNKRFYNHLLKFNSLKKIARKSDKEKKLYLRAKKAVTKIPNNPETNYIFDRIVNNEKINVKDLYNILNYQMKLFLASAPFKAMRKQGLKYSYIRTVEPHKDGVPHFHMMFYVPIDYMAQIKDQFTKSFSASRNSKPLRGCDKGQLESFQWDINKPSAYVLKYVTKSFMDLKNQKTMDYMQAWFVYHRIPRCVTSHTIIPQWVFQKIQPLESDWYYLTDIANAEGGHCEWSKDDDYFKFEDVYSGRTLLYDRGLYKIYYGDKVVKEFGAKKKESLYPDEYFKLSIDEQKEKTLKFDKFEKVPKKFTNKKVHNHIPLVVDGIDMFYINGNVVKQGVKSPNKMKNLDLYDYFKNIDEDIENVNLQHYGHTKNVMIKRGLLHDEIVSLNLYNEEF
ncbi:MAG: hypothetical protein COB67_08870 [SAR324 cluster bacterium]|uniref:Replication gene A protein-like domain-containing protein n=1 Tax=SAR324 cluster bacterium TaxID=2024889 RepID=A0A2A4T0V4_9DELT|nr:MAG: hypothetical protein COB67_08870 [SAR324 cluster bacterium]